MASGFDAQRQVSADNTTNWGNIGGGARLSFGIQKGNYYVKGILLSWRNGP